MVLKGRFADSIILTAPPLKIKRSHMEAGQGSTIANSRRMKLSGITDGTTTTSVTTTSTGYATTSTSLRATIGARCGDNVTVSTVRPTTHQKVRRILEDQTDCQRNGISLRKARRATVVPCIVNNYSIVASKGELARSNNTERETSSIVPRKRTTFINGKIRAKEDDTRCVVHGKSSRKPSSKDETKDLNRSRTTKSTLRTLTKSPSVPAVVSNYREDFSSKDKVLSKLPEESILKRSSAFLANLTHSSGRPSERKENRQSAENGLKTLRSLTSSDYISLPTKSSSFKGYLSTLASEEDEFESFRRSASIRTLPTGWKKKSNVGIKKSVSFSSDTSFEEKRAPFRRTAVHEAKVYHKGVLQDREVRGDRTQAKVPPSWESPSGGPEDLLRAAREVDDAVLKEIVARARNLGINGMDINLADSSGRTAVSYMAGNGAAATLELALSFEGVDPNLPDNEGNTPLHFAAQAGQAECLNILLQRCPDIEVDARNTLGFTPLMKAALQGRTKCAKILLFAGANPTLRDHGRGLRAEQWARFCGRYVCAEVIERFARHRLLERTTSCRWGSEPELAAKVLQGKVTPVPVAPLPSPTSGLKSKIRKVFRTTSGPDRSFSLVSQLTSAALCASSPALPKQSEVPPMVKSLLRPLSVPQLRVTLVAPPEILDKSPEKYGTSFVEKIENAISKPPRMKKKSK